jgi:hypothetical protein
VHETGMAKRMLATDRKLATMAWLIRNDTVVDGMGLYFANDAGTRIGAQGPHPDSATRVTAVEPLLRRC